ncbi:MAG: methyltransferase domain-containing protein [Ferruginibacter sp.]
MEIYQSYFEENRKSWNKRTVIHKGSAFYDLASFKKGKSSLNKIELEELGNVKGKTLLHLQCHFGMDTMSWTREGAKVTGVDFSDEAIHLAKELAAELNIPAEFICANVYDLTDTAKVPSLEGFGEAFDIVFTSYGTIGWLPDLDAWAEIISHFLKPGGTFYIADFHPVLWMMDEGFEQIKYNYFNKETITEEISGTYSDRSAPIKSIEHGWNHPFSEIISALLKHNLQIEQFKEFPYSPYNCFNNLEKGDDDMWRIKGMEEKMPMMYSIKATKRS